MSTTPAAEVPTIRRRRRRPNGSVMKPETAVSFPCTFAYRDGVERFALANGHPNVAAFVQSLVEAAMKSGSAPAAPASKKLKQAALFEGK